MKISNFLEQQNKLFEKAQGELEAARIKQVDQGFSTKMKRDTAKSLKARIDGLVVVRKQVIADYDAQIKRLSADLKRLNDEIKKDEKREPVDTKPKDPVRPRPGRKPANPVKKPVIKPVRKKVATKKATKKAVAKKKKTVKKSTARKKVSRAVKKRRT